MSILVKGLIKKYGEQIAVNDVSFEIKKGNIVGFLGPNGAGKIHYHENDYRYIAC